MVAFTRTRGGLPAADIQFHMGAAYFEDHGAETYDGHCMVIAPVLVSPRARGQVWLRSADPTDKPRILTNSLSEPEDVESMVAGMALAREIAAQGPLSEIVLKELKPGPATVDRQELEADLRTAADADLPPGRHGPDERHRTSRPSSTRGCASTGSRACG